MIAKRSPSLVVRNSPCVLSPLLSLRAFGFECPIQLERQHGGLKAGRGAKIDHATGVVELLGVEGWWFLYASAAASTPVRPGALSFPTLNGRNL